MRWVAELEPAALWQPVAEASGDAAWCVQDAQGLRLYCPARQIAGLDGGVGRGHTGWKLGLRGVFVKSHGAADSYAFEQAIWRAAEAARNRLIELISERMERERSVA